MVQTACMQPGGEIDCGKSMNNVTTGLQFDEPITDMTSIEETTTTEQTTTTTERTTSTITTTYATSTHFFETTMTTSTTFSMPAMSTSTTSATTTITTIGSRMQVRENQFTNDHQWRSIDHYENDHSVDRTMWRAPSGEPLVESTIDHLGNLVPIGASLVPVEFSVLSVGVCTDGVWTVWLDNDKPSEMGDWEVIDEVAQISFSRGTVFCSNPKAYQARVVGTETMMTTQKVQFGSNGLVCVNSEQSDNMCLNYEVRFCCVTSKLNGSVFSQVRSLNCTFGSLI